MRDPGVQFAECGCVVINSLHMEGLEFAADDELGAIGIGTEVGCVTVNGYSQRFATFGGTTNSMIQFTGGSGQTVQVNGFNNPAADGGNDASTLAFVDFGSVENASVTLTGINPAGPLYTIDQVNAGAGSHLVITDGAQVTYAPALGWTTFATGGSANLLNSASGGSLVLRPGNGITRRCSSRSRSPSPASSRRCRPRKRIPTSGSRRSGPRRGCGAGE